MSICANLAKALGGKWTYYGQGFWQCDDEKRRVYRCSVLGGFSGDEHAGSEWWVYGDGEPRRAEAYVAKKVHNPFFAFGEFRL